MVKKSGKKKSKSKKNSEKVCEVFEIEKDGKEKKQVACGSVPTKHATKKQIKAQEKILKIILISLGLIIILFLAGYYLINSMQTFEYKGVNFEKVREGNLILYRTSFPVTYKGEPADFNIYLRNDPKNLLKEVPFEGGIIMKNNMVINVTEEFNCDGDGILAVANLNQFYQLGGKMIKDENATCPENGEYMFVRLRAGNESSVEQFGPTCYNLNIKDCEILKVTERFMLELFAESKK